MKRPPSNQDPKAPSMTLFSSRQKHLENPQLYRNASLEGSSLLKPHRAVSSKDPNDCFAGDVQKLIHTSSFRRLQAKTQVWGIGRSDFFRTRLTHTLETAQIAGELAHVLNLPPQGAIACALAHDLGHPPFAHEGAALIDRFCRDVSDGTVGFDDNTQNIRIISSLASHPSASDLAGLNLTAAVIDGLQKRKYSEGDILNSSSAFVGYPDEAALVIWARECCGTSTHLHPFAHLLNVADDIAYACHDFEDALKAEILPLEHLLEIFNTRALPPLLAEALEAADLKQLFITRPTNRKDNSIETDASEVSSSQELSPRGNSLQGSLPFESKQTLGLKALSKEKSRIKHALVSSIFSELNKMASASLIDAMRRPIRPSTEPLYETAPRIYELTRWLKAFVREHVIDQPQVQSQRFSCLNALREYLSTYYEALTSPKDYLHRHALKSFPLRWQERFNACSTDESRLRVFIDYVAGMSDEYFTLQSKQLHSPGAAIERWR